jgi:hypothetical protein
MSFRSTVATLRGNPALCVTLFIPLLSLAVGSTLLTLSIKTQQDMANTPAVPQSELLLPPLSKTSWREPLDSAPVQSQPPAPVDVQPVGTVP